MHAPAAFPLATRVIAVTGASRGIGHAIAQMLQAAGAQVLASARQAPQPALPGIDFVTLDVAEESSVQAFAQRAQEMGADALVHNAGVGVFGPLEAAEIPPTAPTK
ncbi:MAG: SDR family NAD(P)-dependent oxidoreductase, partial [Rubrivivax sp.]